MKGSVFGVLSLLIGSFIPIIILLRPKEIDAYIFTAMYCLIEALIFLPLVLIERGKIKQQIQNQTEDSQDLNSLLNGWKRNKKFLIYLGINFAVAQVLFVIAFELAGAINATLAARTSIIFALLFAFIFSYEKISKVKIFFSIFLIFGLILAITQGSFNLLEFNIGVLIMIISAMLWMLAHSLTKPIFDKNELTPTQLVFSRNLLSGIFLISTYFIFFPKENVNILLNPINYYFFIVMGFFYAFNLYFWYKSVSYLEVSKATIINSPAPILTALFAFIILGEIFTIYHLIGSIIIIFSIFMIVKEKNED